MSRIFEALRQSLHENVATVASAEEIPAPVGLPRSAPLQPRGFEDAEVLDCTIPPEGRVVGSGQNRDLAAEKFRLLAHRLNRLRGQRSLVKVVVTSSIPKEGKTVISTNLAATLAHSARRVMLVDADLRQPGTHRVLGLPRLPGLAEVLSGELKPASAIRRLSPLNLHYLPAGRPSSNPFELLQGLRFRDLLQALAAAFDWVIFDTPPLIPSADAQCLANAADGVLLVVRPGITPREGFKQACAALEGARVLGLISNASNDDRHQRYYYAHYSEPYSGAGSGNGTNGKVSVGLTSEAHVKDLVR